MVLKESVRMVAQVNDMGEVAGCSILAETTLVAQDRCQRVQTDMLQKQRTS
jgi:hypothetical protein